MNLLDNTTEANVIKAGSIFNKLLTSLTGLTDRKEGILVSASSVEFKSNLLRCSAHGKIDLAIRNNHPGQIDTIESKIFELLPKKYTQLLDFYIEIGNKRPVMQRTPEVEALWKVFRAKARKLDIRLLEEHRWNASDLSFVPDNKCLIDGAGPVGMKEDNGQEYIQKHSLVERSALLASVINSLDKNLWESISAKLNQDSALTTESAPSQVTE
jgi:hypothetical protein